MKKIGLFYAPAKGSTELVANKVAERFGKENVELHLVDENTSTEDLNKYDKLVFGISTVGRDSWDSNYSKIGWDLLLPKIEKMDLNGKTVAIFGLGNHILYPDNFVDALGFLGRACEAASANLIGKVSIEGYDYSDSAGIIDDMFYGLPIDEDNDNDLTDKRLDNWTALIKSDLGL